MSEKTTLKDMSDAAKILSSILDPELARMIVKKVYKVDPKKTGGKIKKAPAKKMMGGGKVKPKAKTKMMYGSKVKKRK